MANPTEFQIGQMCRQILHLAEQSALAKECIEADIEYMRGQKPSFWSEDAYKNNLYRASALKYAPQLAEWIMSKLLTESDLYVETSVGTAG